MKLTTLLVRRALPVDLLVLVAAMVPRTASSRLASSF
jgi:hypothetical protein